MNIVRKTFVSIEINQLRGLLGLDEQLGDAIQFADYLRQRGMTVAGSFVAPGTHAISSQVAVESGK